MTKFRLAKDTSAATSLNLKYKRFIDECEMKIRDLEDKKIAYVLACIKCMNASVMTSFTAEKAHEIGYEFSKCGFESQAVVEFLQDIKETFFKELIENCSEDVMNDIECIRLSSDKATKYSTFSDDHFYVEFMYKRTAMYFSIALPIRENSIFNENTYNDPYKGRFLLCGLNESLVNARGIPLPYNCSFALDCIAECFNPDELSSFIKNYLRLTAIDSTNSRTNDRETSHGNIMNEYGYDI